MLLGIHCFISCSGRHDPVILKLILGWVLHGYTTTTTTITITASSSSSSSIVVVVVVIVVVVVV